MRNTQARTCSGSRSCSKLSKTLNDEAAEISVKLTGLRNYIVSRVQKAERKNIFRQIRAVVPGNVRHEKPEAPAKEKAQPAPDEKGGKPSGTNGG